MTSTRDLSGLPEVAALRRAFQSMAMLDAIIQDEWEYRYYSFDADTSKERLGFSVGSMRDGCGNDLHAVFGPAGCLIRGFHHEAPMSPFRETPPRIFPGVLDDIPADIAPLKKAIHADWWEKEGVTFCVWRRPADKRWQHGRITFPAGDDPDGSRDLLSAYDGKPETYREWACEYFDGDGEREFPLDAVTWVFEHRPLTKEIVEALNPGRKLRGLAKEIKQIGYPKGP